MAGGTKRSRDMRLALRRLIPLAPLADAAPILEAALARHLKHLPPSVALWLAVTSHVRHRHTGYEAMLVEGYDRNKKFYELVEDYYSDKKFDELVEDYDNNKMF